MPEYSFWRLQRNKAPVLCEYAISYTARAIVAIKHEQYIGKSRRICAEDGFGLSARGICVYLRTIEKVTFAHMSNPNKSIQFEGFKITIDRRQWIWKVEGGNRDGLAALAPLFVAARLQMGGRCGNAWHERWVCHTRLIRKG
ncbi:hypothetical protein IFR05_016459 [Cadophora sp. M221]|nr:hypothetical protein IFR05_016459 [Cadophora sp. M221]